MQLGRMLRRRAKEAVPPLLFLSLVGYFGWQATRGDHGLRAHALREQQLATVQGELVQATAEQEAWERRVAALRTARLDPDLLDERARAMLNRADPSEIVVPYEQGHKLF